MIYDDDTFTSEYEGHDSEDVLYQQSWKDFLISFIKDCLISLIKNYLISFKKETLPLISSIIKLRILNLLQKLKIKIHGNRERRQKEKKDMRLHKES